jgi:hypothetical protein
VSGTKKRQNNTKCPYEEDTTFSEMRENTRDGSHGCFLVSFLEKILKLTKNFQK